MTDGIPQVCNVGNCTASEKWDLTEIPMWSTYSPGSMAAISSMDPSGNDFDTYKQQVCGEGVGGCACVCVGGDSSHQSATAVLDCPRASTGGPHFARPVRPLMQLEWRLSGNRAPLGMFFHAGD